MKNISQNNQNNQGLGDDVENAIKDEMAKNAQKAGKKVGKKAAKAAKEAVKKIMSKIIAAISASTSGMFIPILIFIAFLVMLPSMLLFNLNSSEKPEMTYEEFYQNISNFANIEFQEGYGKKWKEAETAVDKQYEDDLKNGKLNFTHKDEGYSKRTPIKIANTQNTPKLSASLAIAAFSNMNTIVANEDGTTKEVNYNANPCFSKDKDAKIPTYEKIDDIDASQTDKNGDGVVDETPKLSDGGSYEDTEVDFQEKIDELAEDMWTIQVSAVKLHYENVYTVVIIPDPMDGTKVEIKHIWIGENLFCEYNYGVVLKNDFEKQVQEVFNLTDDQLETAKIQALVCKTYLDGEDVSNDHEYVSSTSIKDAIAKYFFIHERFDENLKDGYGGPTPTWNLEGNVTSEYGYRNLSNSNEVINRHTGIDVISGGEQNIIASHDGVVVATVRGMGNTYPSPNYGNYVLLYHGDREVNGEKKGIFTLYAHCKSEDPLTSLAVGEEVKKNQVIAHIGNSGCSTGNHVHFETIVGDFAHNPREFIG